MQRKERAVKRASNMCEAHTIMHLDTHPLTVSGSVYFRCLRHSIHVVILMLYALLSLSNTFAKL
jgi:hypothetical protein